MDLSGKVVKKIIAENILGNITVDINASDLVNGTSFVKYNLGNSSNVSKLVIAK